MIFRKSLPLNLIAIMFVLGSLGLQGCANLPTSKDAGSESKNPVESGPKSLTEVLKQSGKSGVNGNSGTGTKVAVVKRSTDLSIQGVRLKNTTFDLPVVMNSRVQFWVDYFCGRGRGFFEKYLERSEFFIPYIQPLLKQNGMPEDLVYLAMIESGFNNLARSRARAVGPWQFISATGKRYGLMVNWWVDERRDIRKSTLAAVEYLRDLYGMFESWELAAAAYNAGEAKVARAVRRYGTRDFWAISRHSFLRPETRDYVPKMFAAAIIAKNRTQFGFAAATVRPGADEAVAGNGEIVKVIKSEKPDVEDPNYKKEKAQDSKSEVSLAALSQEDRQAALAEEQRLAVEAERTARGSGDEIDPENESADEMADADPESERERSSDLDKPVLPALKVAKSGAPSPASTPEVVADARRGTTTELVPLAKPVQTPHVNKSGEVGGEELLDFEVKSPADLLKVARAAGLSYQTIKSLNPEVLRWCTPPNTASYRIKIPASVKERFLATYNHEAYPRQVQFMTYKVGRGETIAKIASHFGIKVDPIADLNGVSTRALLRHGARVLLPMPNDRSRTFSSLEIRDPPERSRRHRRGRHRHRQRAAQSPTSKSSVSVAVHRAKA